MYWKHLPFNPNKKQFDDLIDKWVILIHQSTNIHIIIHVEVNATSFFHQFQFFAVLKRLREYNFYYCVNKIFRFYIKTSGAAKGLKIWVRLTLECTCLYKVFRRNGFCFSTHQHFCDAKGQFISKCLFSSISIFCVTEKVAWIQLLLLR